MTPERWRRVDELFASALELEGEARRRFLDECDPGLRGEVESMLRFARESEEFLETPVWSADAFEHEPQRNEQFVPGDIIAGRYRIVGLLGRGGMGEVYRADDLKLSQPVALKFLAPSLSRSGAALARFHREVSLARQVSHRNVCRMYDIGEHAGQHFLSMEYVRGEELSSLLRRIGRLPLDKALDVARQLCAGLAAIHGAGVLHRDLKPANVMIDERGDVRIADFGIAALTGDVRGAEIIGTPVYMAPEQLAGGEATVRSDVYALGIVLHEAFTGKRPSEPATDIDPAVERVIARCLEKDPSRRPPSALHVAAALPGGDPLAAALAAGETPSPQMVAAAVREGSLRPLQATLWLLAIVAAIVFFAIVSRDTMLYRFVPMERSPEVLRANAEELVRDAGVTAAPGDVATAFELDAGAIAWVTKFSNWETFRRAPLPAITFWYRRSPRPLLPASRWLVEPRDPPHTLAGMITIHLDTAGRLLAFEAVPPQDEPDATSSQQADWPRFFARAGLDLAAFTPAAPRWTPPHFSDRRFSWTGVHPARPELPLRVEAASYRGAPVWFQVVFPWQQPERQPAASETVAATDTFGAVLLTFYFGAIALAALLAWKNLRLGRGDRRGAFRLALFVFVIRIVYWIFMAHHVAAIEEVELLIRALHGAVYWAGVVGLLYLALEPFVRRRWPERLISWSRLIAGDVRDPLVGRDILIGGAFGVAFMAPYLVLRLLPIVSGGALREPRINSEVLLDGLSGAAGFVPVLSNQIVAAVTFPLIFLSIVLFFAMVTRRSWAAFAITWVLFYFALRLHLGDDSIAGWLAGLILPTLLVVCLARYGLLALVSMFFFSHLWAFYPATTELTAWYAKTFVMQAVLLIAIALWAFRVALAGQQLFAEE